MTQDIDVTIHVKVTVDESKFTPEWMEEYRKYFYEYYTVEEHMNHLAFLAATGQIAEWPQFIEGYGPSEEMGIKVKIGS